MKRIRRMRAAALLLAALAAGAAALSCSSDGEPSAASGPDTLYIASAGRYEFDAPDAPDPRLLPEELGGLAWIGRDDYLAVGDAHACVYRITVRVDPKSGRILDATFGEPTALRDSTGALLPEATQGEDREGIACGADSSTVWISNERTGRDSRYSSIAEHQLPNGRMLRVVGTDANSAMRGFASQRSNRGLESITRIPDGSGYWTANEAPLRIDGPEANDSIGAVVRLMRMDRSMNPVAEVAYPIDGYPARISSPFFLAGNEVSGVSELLALPDGRLLVLERAFSGDSTGAADFRNRIYLVDPSGGTDVSKGALAEGLAGRTYEPVRKKRLWELHSGFTNSNFEGMALGPALAGGDRLVLLVADNNGGSSETLYALRLHLPPGTNAVPPASR